MENERPIEKLLRRYARKRRDDSTASGLEMHPATRRMLQGEVSRQFPKPATPDTKSSPALKSWWPRLVWALPVLVVLGVGVWALVESQRPKGVSNLAMTESASPAKSLESVARNEPLTPPKGNPAALKELAAAPLADAEAPRVKDTTSAVGLEEKTKLDHARGLALDAPAPSVSSAAVPAPEVANLDKAAQEKAVAGQESLARDARTDTLAAHRMAEEPAVIAGAKLETVRAQPSTPAENLGAERSFGGKDESGGPALARTRSVAPPSAAAPSLSLSPRSSTAKVEYDQAQVSAPTVVQRFVQTTAVVTSGSLEKKHTEPPAVLDAFQVEQTGNQLRVIDSDGSSYDGSIQFATGEALSETVGEANKNAVFQKRYGLTSAQAGQPTPSPSQEGSRNYFFRVTGTNRTLQQPVAFTGNLLVLTNALPAAETGLTLSPTAKNQFPQGQALPTLLNSSISGKVQLGRDQEMQIKAVPAAR